MKKLILLVAIVVSQVAVAKDKVRLSDEEKASLTASSVEVTDVTDLYEATNMYSASDFGLSDLNAVGATLDQADVVLDKVIAIGTKVWNLVEKGRPVTNINMTSASALPQGSRNWRQLENWAQVPRSRVFNVSIKNGFGVQVVQATFRVTNLYGGSVEGAGRYIGYASVETERATVMWGWNLEAQAKVEKVYNIGSRANPVAGMIIRLKVRSSTVINDIRDSVDVYLSGTGGMSSTRDRK